MNHAFKTNKSWKTHYVTRGLGAPLVLLVLLLWKLYFAQHAQAVEKYMLRLFDSLLKLEAINA